MRWLPPEATGGEAGEIAVTDFVALVDRYLAIWNEPDPDARTTALAQLWTDDGTYTDPFSAVSGRGGLATVVTKTRERFPGHHFRQVGSVDGHHDVARFGWELVSAEGESIVVGLDVMVVSPDGRIRAIHGFLDTVPSHG
jgi:hypothetical protein